MKILLKNIYGKIREFDLFELGNSAVLYYILIFYLVPFLMFLGISGNLADRMPFHFKDFLYIIIGLFFLIVGYFSNISSVFFGKSSNFLKREWDFSKAPLVFGIIFLFGLIAKVIRISEGGFSYLNRNPLFEKNHFYNLVGIFDWFSYIALAIAFISFFYLKKNSDNRYKIWSFIAWGIFVIEMIYSLFSCSRMLAFAPVLIYLIIRWHVWEKSYFKTTIILFLAVIILFPIGVICRFPAYTNFSHSQVIQSIISKGQVDNQIFIDDKQTIISLARNVGNFAVGNFLVRIDQSAIFSGILAHPQPFLYGGTFHELIFTFGPPRFIWKDKPVSINSTGVEFGRRIGVVGPNVQSSVGSTIIGDLYLNFGILGIVLGMLFFGVFFRFIFDFLIKQSGVSLSGAMIYGILWIQIIKGFEDWIAPVYVGIIRITVILIIIHFLLVKKNR